MKSGWCIGLMTGTALDGEVDMALLKTDGKTIDEFGVFKVNRYPNILKKDLSDCFYEAQEWNFRGEKPLSFEKLENRITEFQSEAVLQLLKENSLKKNSINVVGFHGHTILHRPPRDNHEGKTLQIGNGILMAKRLGIPVAYNFRSRDVREGGHGAPLCPIYHNCLMNQIEIKKRTAVLNLGGVANITYNSFGNDLIAFDTGPANAPINDFIRSLGLGDMDINGEIASRGLVDEEKLKALLTNPYFSLPYPKSLDRFDFSQDLAKGLSPENGAALLTALVASSVCKALDLLPERPEVIILCGGGRKNLTVVNELEKRAKVIVKLAEDFGWRGDAIEAECFAFLGSRVINRLPISFPNTTGAKKPLTGGLVAIPSK